MTRYTKAKPTGRRGFSKWIQPVRRGYLMACCDCGLVHVLDFRIGAGDRVQFRARRAVKRTREHRKQLVARGKR